MKKLKQTIAKFLMNQLLTQDEQKTYLEAIRFSVYTHNRRGRYTDEEKVGKVLDATQHLFNNAKPVAHGGDFAAETVNQPHN